MKIRLRKSDRKKQEDRLDALHSELVRKRAIQRAGGCERCGRQMFDIQKDNGVVFPAWKQLDCAHLVSRWHRSTRWNEDAALGLCGGCHMWIDHEEAEKIALAVRILGQEKYDLLKARSRMEGVDRDLLEFYLKEKIKELMEVTNGHE